MNNVAIRRLLALAGAVMVASCARMEWQKPDTEAAVMDQDLQRCQQQAKLHAQALAGAADKPTVIVSPQGQVGVVRSPYVVPAGDPAAEYDSLRSCMRNKGYREVPSRQP